MKLNTRTVEILKNFATINQGLIFKPGSTLRTMNVKNNVFATAVVPDVFAKEFAVYDLNELLSTFSLFSDPDVSFTDEYLQLQSGSQKVKYFYSSPSVIVSPPDREIKMPKVDIEFKLWEEDLEKILKASNIMKLKNLSITPSTTSPSGIVTVMNKSSTGSNVGNRLEIEVEMENFTESTSFNNFISIDLLKVIPANYTVSVVHGKLAKFESENLTYYIALEVE